eukprot:RCo047055
MSLKVPRTFGFMLFVVEAAVLLMTADAHQVGNRYCMSNEERCNKGCRAFGGACSLCPDDRSKFYCPKSRTCFPDDFLCHALCKAGFGKECDRCEENSRWWTCYGEELGLASAANLTKLPDTDRPNEVRCTAQHGLCDSTCRDAVGKDCVPCREDPSRWTCPFLKTDSDVLKQ